MRLALIGQPNCGKSTLFNQVAGYRAETGNFAGTTVTFTESKVRVLGQVVEIVDLPGTYTLAGTNQAEREVLRYLASHQVDGILNVVDATHLPQGLSLTFELMELGRPLVVGLNMMDEAARLGMSIDGQQLQELLGTPVTPLIASKGRGIREVFTTALETIRQNEPPRRLCYSADIEAVIEAVIETLITPLQDCAAPLPPKALAIKLLEGDIPLLAQVENSTPTIRATIEEAQQQIQASRGQLPVWVMSAERHGLAANVAQTVTRSRIRRLTFRDRLDDFLLHPVFGYVALVVILLLFFQSVYRLGSTLEAPLLAGFDAISKLLSSALAADTLLFKIAKGLIDGIAGGMAIVLPYLLPFLFGLGFLEDVGYLPRVAFLMDALMHRLGLHGKAIVPFILGYGCNVPAVMSTRLMEDKRDRFLAAALATLVPCAARLAVVFGLVAFYLGPTVALVIYLFNLFVIALTGRALSRLMPEDSPGLILEMPTYRLPTLRTIFNKTWFRVREFVVEAWPLLIGGSVALAMFNFLNITPFFDVLVRPFTWILGLPIQTGVPIIFGILRKELSLVMLRQALNVADFSVALSAVQMVTFTVFVVFYIPCLATLAVLRRELGTRAMLLIAALTVFIATLAALLARGVALVI